MKKPIKAGLDYLYDKNWQPRKAASKEQVQRIGKRIMPKHLKKAGFVCIVFECETHYRINYAK